MDDLPLPIAAVPHPGLLWLGGARRPIGVDVLRHSDVGNARGLVADQVDVRVQDGGVDWFTVFRPHWRVQIKDQRVKVQNSQNHEGNLHPNRKSTHSFQSKSGGSQGLPPDSPEPRARTPSRLGRTFSWGGGGETSKIRAWFRGRTGRCPSYLRVAFKVSVADCFDELLSDFNDVLLPHWQTQKKVINVSVSQLCWRQLSVCAPLVSSSSMVVFVLSDDSYKNNMSHDDISLVLIFFIFILGSNMSPTLRLIGFWRRGNGK